MSKYAVDVVNWATHFGLDRRTMRHGNVDATEAVQDCIDTASRQGWSVFFPEGIYAVDALTLRSDVHLYGPNSGMRKGTIGRAILRQRSADQTLLTGTSITNVLIDGLELDGNSLGNVATAGGFAGDNRGIHLSECSDVKIRSCYIHDFTYQGVYVDVGDGSPATRDIHIEGCEIEDVGARNTSADTPYSAIPNPGAWLPLAIGNSSVGANGLGSYVYVRRNKIHGALNTLISVTGTDYVYLEDNELYDTDSNGIQLGTYARFGFVRRNRIHTFTALYSPTSEGRGISVHSTGNENDFVFEKNHVDDATLYGIDARVPRVTVRDNVVIDTAQTSGQSSSAGIFVNGDGANDILVVGNTIHNAAQRGIYVLAGNATTIARTTVTGNIVTAPGNNAINVTRSGSGAIADLVIQNNSAASGQLAGIVIGFATNCLIEGNKITSCNQSSTANTDGMSLFSSCTGLCAHNKIAGANHTYDLDANGAGAFVFSGNDLTSSRDLIPALSNDATPSVIGGSVFKTGGTTTITDFDGGYEGKVITVLSDHAITITDGTNIFLNGSANFVMASSDSLTLVQKADGKWYEISRSVN